MDFTVRSNGTLTWTDGTVRCVLGRSGILENKWEGDGGTPMGRYVLRRVLYRPDRESRPVTALPVDALSPTMGWCDDPTHRDYNRMVELPHPASCESLWRDDGVYDILTVLGHNDDPVIPFLGSAIFMHLVRPAQTPTEGCVALSHADLLAVLAAAQPDDALKIIR